MGRFGEFKDRHEGERLLAFLETGITPDRKRPNVLPEPGENPLYEFRQTETHNFYVYPVIQEVFDLLRKNGYGHTPVNKQEQDLQNELRGHIAKRDPAWIGSLEGKDFDKFVYFFNHENNKGVNTIHYLPERLCDGTVHAILKRAMELGSYENDLVSTVHFSTSPAPMGPR